uniref:Protein krueppel n=1 Tax=Anopheles farauti TaxID=69004 RepID=A0A9I3GJA6_9DIPT
MEQHRGRSVSNTCRFCLCPDEEYLTPLAAAIDDTLSYADVELLTGVSIITDEHPTYVVCEQCLVQLNNFVSFRNICLSNESFFRELCLTVNEYPGTGDETAVVAQEATERLSKIDLIVVKKRSKRQTEATKNMETTEECAFDTSKEPHDYCANRIEPGEDLISDDEQHDRIDRVPQKKTVDCNALFVESMRIIRQTQLRQQQQQQQEEELALEAETSTCSVTKASRSTMKHRQLCEVCGKTVHNINDHMPTHTKEMKYVCPHCPVRMTNHGNLYRHVQAVHLKKIIKSCDVCGKGFTSQASYRSHMRAGHGIGETYQCKLCPKSFNHPGNYRVHLIRCHSDEKKFKCVTCGKQFKEKRDHRNHQRVHSDEKPFACTQCPKRFKSEYARKTHELTHSGTVFQCAYCDKAYRYKCLLSTHLKKEHPVEQEEVCVEEVLTC